MNKSIIHSGDKYGKIFVVTTWGTSHGPEMGTRIEGCPKGLKISQKDIQTEVNRRRPANSQISTTRVEKDEVLIKSGIKNNKTDGKPINLTVKNKNIRPLDYKNVTNSFRPGHADIANFIKYGNSEETGGGRASGRETVSRVMAGATAKAVLKKENKTEIFGHTIQVGKIKTKNFDKNFIEKNPLRTSDKSAFSKMMKLVENTRKNGDSVGAIIEIIIKNPPKGLGEPVFDKLDAELAKALMSIGAIKGIEFGSGFKSSELKGSQNNDEMEIKNGKINFLSNNSGGILGGISTGENIIIRLAIKPVPSISIPQKTITKNFKNTEIQILGRHDCCLAPRIIPVAEAMCAIVLTDMLLRNK
ncbi:chorismate synthase [Candidatus Gracilibacteria bacterium]|nr:chorismate synthase [Candidatus Gracilibacteria bacterium]